MKKNIIIILTLIQGVLLVLSGCTRMVSSEISGTEAPTTTVTNEVSETEDTTTTITKETEETTKEEFDSGELNLTGYEQYDEVIKYFVQVCVEENSAGGLRKHSFSENWIKDEAIANGGFYLTDLNNDEIPELLLGGNGDGAWAGRVYEIYTIKDEKAVKLASGSFELRDNGIIYKNTTGGAANFTLGYYKLADGEFVLQQGLIYYDDGNPEREYILNLCEEPLLIDDWLASASSNGISVEEANVIKDSYGEKIPIQFTTFWK